MECTHEWERLKEEDYGEVNNPRLKSQACKSLD